MKINTKERNITTGMCWICGCKIYVCVDQCRRGLYARTRHAHCSWVRIVWMQQDQKKSPKTQFVSEGLEPSNRILIWQSKVLALH